MVVVPMTKLSATLVAATQPVISVPCSGAESFIAYAARVSSDRPKEEWGEKYEGLLRYCMRNKHWSVFEMADAVVEIEAPRDISRQLLRHRSFCFQEFSQRYSDHIEFTDRDYRHQDYKNRQNSLDTLTMEDYHEVLDYQEAVRKSVEYSYERLREMDIAKECARVILPEGLTMSKLFMKGSLRSWMHYLETRLDPTTQREHRDLAALIKTALLPVFPTILGMEKDQ
jgi:thymidylate synthase (FAD)